CAAGACPDQVRLFKRTFGNGGEVTEGKAIAAAAAGLNLDWAARNLFTATALKQYEEATATALKQYEEATATALKQYEEARATALKQYEEARAPAWKQYEEARAPALKQYEEAT